MNLVVLERDAGTHVVEAFLDVAGSSLETFRYFNKRDVGEALGNHLVTIVGHDDGPVAYGHLDASGDDVWLGICIAEQHVGNGLGRKMMEALVKYADENGVEELSLTVDAENYAAIALYENFGFAGALCGAHVLMKRRAHG